jgi:heat shock protein HspQ
MSNHKFSMNSIVKDRITGFQGMVLGISEEETGATHYGVCPVELDKDGKIKDWKWLDQSRLISIEKAEEDAPKWEWKHEFGMYDYVKDKHTGYKGVVISIVDYDTGCVSYGLQPKELTRDGELAKTSYLPAERLALIKSAHDDSAKKKIEKKRNSPYGIEHPSSYR